MNKGLPLGTQGVAGKDGDSLRDTGPQEACFFFQNALGLWARMLYEAYRVELVLSRE